MNDYLLGKLEGGVAIVGVVTVQGLELVLGPVSHVVDSLLNTKAKMSDKLISIMQQCGVPSSSWWGRRCGDECSPVSNYARNTM